jgi:hypothetical protein
VSRDPEVAGKSGPGLRAYPFTGSRDGLWIESALLCASLPTEDWTMAKGQEKPKTNNKPKLTVKEKKKKKKDKAASK